MATYNNVIQYYRWCKTGLYLLIKCFSFKSLCTCKIVKLESVQKRSLKIITNCGSYSQDLVSCSVPPLYERRQILCKIFFIEMQNTNHKLNKFLKERTMNKNIRNHAKFVRPICRTNRFKNSFIPHCLFSYQ